PDLPDHRDFTFAAPTAVLKALPAKVNLHDQCPKTVYDQGQLGSCTANAIAGAIEFDQIKQKQAQATPSRLFIYYNERAMEHSVQFDAGAQIRDGIKSVAQIGACHEHLWPYDDTPPPTEDSPCPTCKFAQKPTANCYTEALKHQVLVYRRGSPGLSTLKKCPPRRLPVRFGVTR